MVPLSPSVDSQQTRHRGCSSFHTNSPATGCSQSQHRKQAGWYTCRCGVVIPNFPCPASRSHRPQFLLPKIGCSSNVRKMCVGLARGARGGNFCAVFVSVGVLSFVSLWTHDSELVLPLAEARSLARGDVGGGVRVRGDTT